MEMGLPRRTIIALISITIQFSKFSIILSHLVCILCCADSGPSIHSLSTYCVPGTVVSSGDIAVTKTDRNSCLPGVYIRMRSKKNKASYLLLSVFYVSGALHTLSHLIHITTTYEKGYSHHFTEDKTEVQID